MPQNTAVSNRPFNRFALPALFFFLGVFCILFHLGTCGLLETSEGRYASVGRAMLDSGDYLVPVHNGIRHLTKPPLTYWAAALGIHLFGANEFGARFFLSFAAGFTVLGCFFIGKALFDIRVGAASALILICSLFFQVQFRGLTTDPYLAMWETWMVLAFIRFLQCHGGRREKRWKAAFWFFAGLAMLTKGPPGLLPLAGLLPAAWFSGYKNHLKCLFQFVGGWFIFLLVGLGWYIYLALKIPGLFSYFVVDETIRRVAADSHQRSAPFYLFLFLLPAGIFPWTGFFLRGLKTTLENFKKINEFKLLLLWLLVPLTVFSLSKSKLAAYVLPLLVPVALIAGHALVEIFFDLKKKAAELRFHLQAVAVTTLIFSLAMVFYSYSEHLVSPRLNGNLRFVGVVWTFISLFLFTQRYYGNRRFSLALLALLAPSLIFFAISGLKGNEQLQSGKFMPSQWLLLKRLAKLPPEQKIINIEEMIEGWYFYTGRSPVTWNVNRIVRFDENAAAKLVLHGEEDLRRHADINSMLVLRQKDFARVAGILNCNLKTLAIEGNWLVVMPERKARN